MAYDYRSILCEKGKGVLKVTLNRPDTLNALNPDLERELHAALQEGDDDPLVFCMIVCGAGRAFSSGYAMGAVPGRKGCQIPARAFRPQIKGQKNLVERDPVQMECGMGN